MSRPIPLNNLDRAIRGASKPSGMPELFRRLVEGKLWFLLPYHPEVEGEMLELKNGMPLPFSLLQDDEGQIVPLFSSFQRGESALQKASIPPRTYSMGSMEAKLVLQILGGANLRAVVNKSCPATGEIILPADLMRDLASGKALTPFDLSKSAPQETGKLNILDPTDYPTRLIQSAFEIMRLHRNFRAAWVLGVAPDEAEPAEETEPPPPRLYQLLVLMDPRDKVIYHDFNVAVIQATNREAQVRIGLLDENNSAYIADFFRQVTAFYVAVDYELPPGARTL